MSAEDIHDGDRNGRTAPPEAVSGPATQWMWDRSQLLRRALPFVGLALLAFVTVPLTGQDLQWEFTLTATALMLAVVVLVLVAPWHRLPRWLALVPPFAGLVIIGLLREAEGGTTPASGILVLIPVLWLALYGSRWELIAILGAAALVFALPIVLVGEPDYPSSEWRRAILITATGAFLGLVTQGLVETARARAIEAVQWAHAEHQQEAYLRAVMDSAAEGIAALDRDGRATFVNPAGARTLGYSVEELSGREFHRLIHHTRPDGSHYPVDECPVLESLRTGRASSRDDEVFWRSDGSSFPVEYRSKPILIEGQIEGVVVTFSDISERLEVQRMKDEFVSVVSHELRTPLTSIRGSLGLVEGGVFGELDPELSKMISVATTNSDRLIRLINDILDAERLESGRTTMNRRSVELADLMRQTEALLAPAAAEAGVELAVEPLEVTLYVDPDRIIQTLVNLIGNAIKFSPDGAPVTVSGVAENGRVRVSVRDRGPGIPPDDRDRIFDRFSQLDSSTTRQRPGSGLGLAIARSIVEQHGGRIWVESEPGEGSTFAFELPRTGGETD